jgi:sec-independent protein translocase protein TatA
LSAKALRDYQFPIGGIMPIHFGPTELAIILVIVILLFGVGRIGRLGADFGRAISEFRKAATYKEDENEDEA